MFGTILASVILLSLGEGTTWARDVLFATLGVVSLLGALIFIPMPSVEGADDKHSGFLDTSKLAVTDPKVGLMIPLMLTNGMTLAFFLGDFQTDITCPVAGSGFTGFVIASFFGVNAVSSAMWGRLISGKMPRRVVFFLAAGLVALFLALKTTWRAPSNYELPAGSKDWKLVTEPKARSAVNNGPMDEGKKKWFTHVYTKVSSFPPVAVLFGINTIADPFLSRP